MAAQGVYSRFSSSYSLVLASYAASAASARACQQAPVSSVLSCTYKGADCHACVMGVPKMLPLALDLASPNGHFRLSLLVGVACTPSPCSPAPLKFMSAHSSNYAVIFFDLFPYLTASVYPDESCRMRATCCSTASIDGNPVDISLSPCSEESSHMGYVRSLVCILHGSMLCLSE